jgi:hypothetical protein
MLDKDLYSISKLRERYGFSSRQSIDNRMKVLKIEPVAWGKLSSEQVDKMDKLHEHLKKVGKLSNFSDAEVVTPNQIPQNQSNTSLTIGELMRLVEAVASIANRPEPLQTLEGLEMAAEKGWLLTTEQVRQLIGMKPKVRGSDRTFTCGSFSFVKSGKIGQSTAWRVVKVSSEGK